MNDERIEKLLRKAPGTRAPAGLAERLQRGIRLPQTDAGGVTGLDAASWLRRWLPAFSLGVFLLACLVAVGVQSNVLSGLKSDNAKLQAGTSNLDQLRTDNAEYKRLAAQADQLDQLRKDNADLLRLRDEVTQLKAQAQDADKLRAENQSLQAQIKSANATPAQPDFFSQESAKADEVKCINNLKQVGLAARVWAADYNDMMPTNYICMTNELNTWKILQCPSDHSRNVSSWAEVEAENVSYQMLAPGIMAHPENMNVVFAYCPIHHNYVMVDGSVQHLSPEDEQKDLKTVNGRMVFQPPTQ